MISKNLVILFSVIFFMCKGNENETNTLDTLVQKESGKHEIEKSKNVISNNFSGKWSYIHNNERSDYSLNIEVKGDSLIGSHCFIGMSGNRIDCPENNKKTIKGIIRKNGNFEGRFFSDYAKAIFILKMNIASDTLYWTTDNSSSKVFYSNSLKFVKSED